MPLSSEENLLQKQFDFIRRAVIHYYVYIVKQCSEDYGKGCYNPVEHLPDLLNLADLLTLVRKLFYAYLQDEYKGIIKK